MTEISSETRQQTQDVQIASLGMRALGAFGDFILLAVAGALFGVVFGMAPAEGIGFRLEGAPAGLYFAFCLAYFIASEAAWGGTPAKMLFGMRVVRETDGAKIGWQESVVRNFLRVVDVLPVLYLVGFLLALSSPKTQRLGDRIARTVVIRT
jgi:uncharacterized RDD family membrane protein YckC